MDFSNFESQDESEPSANSSVTPAEETKPATATDHINLRVVAQDGNEVYFKIRKTTPMKKLMGAYCERQGVAMDSIRFLFNGQRIQPEQDPSQLDMEDSDVIDAVLAQTGGC
eukprot:CAMPEP_0117042784 /NCGR_PEP_ID=MMETSP0472-20121206/29773_1 /TAXON_ID=693140 ORGANISM="Tiarina fusus, Strain LIS" /NCGR_SAMPLE_ID=MMETSP0472 /ASSEMBLY_ACC=CAM_ASM_000603 /LENGTH=111 /DNA_ID=CAMNT_0004754117 /DNA_START=19 /DNA_END=354 /DNA_ORIENTATION=-